MTTWFMDDPLAHLKEALVDNFHSPDIFICTLPDKTMKVLKGKVSSISAIKSVNYENMISKA